MPSFDARDYMLNVLTQNEEEAISHSIPNGKACPPEWVARAETTIHMIQEGYLTSLSPIQAVIAGDTLVVSHNYAIASLLEGRPVLLYITPKGRIYLSELRAALAAETSRPCLKAPPDWVCTRNAGYAGPCAAKPVEARPPTEVETLRAMVLNLIEKLKEADFRGGGGGVQESVPVPFCSRCNEDCPEDEVADLPVFKNTTRNNSCSASRRR